MCFEQLFVLWGISLLLCLFYMWKMYKAAALACVFPHMDDKQRRGRSSSSAAIATFIYSCRPSHVFLAFAPKGFAVAGTFEDLFAGSWGSRWFWFSFLGFARGHDYQAVVLNPVWLGWQVRKPQTPGGGCGRGGTCAVPQGLTRGEEYTRLLAVSSPRVFSLCNLLWCSPFAPKAQFLLHRERRTVVVESSALGLLGAV